MPAYWSYCPDPVLAYVLTLSPFVQESSGGISSRVPPLSISPDSDQEAWLREQASKALTRQRAAHVAVKTNCK